MKKLLICTLLILLLGSIGVWVYAQEGTADTVTVEVGVENAESAIIRFNLFNKDDVFVAHAYAPVTGGVATLQFAVPEYTAGEMFYARLTEGVKNVTFYDTTYLPNEKIALQTYAMRLEDNSLFLGNVFHLDAAPNLQPLYSDSIQVQLTLTETEQLTDHTVRFNLFDHADNFVGHAYAPVKAEGVVSLNFTVPQYAAGETFVLRMTEGVKAVQYYDGDYMAGEPITLQTYTMTGADGKPQVANSFAMSAFPYTAEDSVMQQAEAFVNEQGYTSKTDYLIWVSLKDYRTFLFRKTAEGWKYRDSFLCTIGAPHTPTITGVYEYIQYQPKWYYDSYWCGPVMRFHNGYALHSTLIKYSGGYYDGRLGVKASLGCIRLHPDNINWLSEITPMYSTIVLTP